MTAPAHTPTGAAPAQAAVPDLRTRLHQSPTPTKLRAFLYGIWVLAALLLLVGEGTLSGARTAMKVVAKDSAPSILAAQEINYALGDLDANAGNYLLGTKAHQQEALRAIEQRRVTVTAKLVTAAQNITFGDAERVPVNTLFDALGRYLELISEARYRKDLGDTAGALLTYGAATDLMHQRMLPAADALDQANYGELIHRYTEQQNRSGGAEIVAGFVALVLIALLVWAQIFLVQRTRRILSLPLVAATLIVAGFGAYLVTRIAVAREDLRIATLDAFESIHDLWQASSVAYDANGDETRYLLGGPRAASYEQAYKDKVKKLTTIVQPEESMLAARSLPGAYQGYFAKELRNTTFRGEREAAVRMIRAFAAYDNVDKKIRAFERGGQHTQAIDVCIGAGANDSNAAFARFDKALHDVIAINQREFESVTQSGSDALGTAGTVVPLASILIAVLAFLGIRPRLREYAA